MSETRYERITDLSHPDLVVFRERAIQECGGGKLRSFRGYHSDFKMFAPEKRQEDIYRFTDQKWYDTNFDYIDCHYVGDKISSISGAIDCNGWMKVAAYHFNLKEYARTHPSRLFWKGGFLERAIEYSTDKKGVFIYIYPHNRGLTAFCNKLKDGTGIPTETGNHDLIRKLQYKGSHEYENVQQELFAIEFTDEELTPHLLQ